MENKQFKALEKKIDELIQLCSQLDQEVKTLRANESSLRNERSQLMQKNEEARSKVESMIIRLKSLEQET